MTDSYDSIPYQTYAHPSTHPDVLCTVGQLFGLAPASPRRCRVLALGCATGTNLMPMAELLPDSEFVGIDRSRVQIDRGRVLAGELGLPNLRLEQADILHVDPASLGSFDYVICHGVFSWVPPHVQQRILALTAAVLRPRGLALISYNVYPGWHMRDVVRRMMTYHQRGFDTPVKQIEQARALLDFVARAVERRVAADDPYALLLNRELEASRRVPDAYLFHEQLERDNAPMYFHEFIDRLATVPLRYVGDTAVNLMVARDMPDDVIETLDRIAGDQLAMEQYLDFLRNRQFRSSVLCRIEGAPQRRLLPDRVEQLRFSMAAKPKLDQPDLAPGIALGFDCTSGAQISSSDPLTKAALIELCARWPATVAFDELLELGLSRVRGAGLSSFEPDRERLAADLIECLLRKAAIARTCEPPLATAPPRAPRTTAFNRLMTAREGWLASLHHHHILPTVPTQQLVPLLDGTRDRAGLIAAVLELVEAGELEFSSEGQTISEAAELERAVGSFVDDQLDKLLHLPALLAESTAAQ